MSVLNCLIVEDEELAAQVIAGYVRDTEGLALKGICEDAHSATRLLETENVQLIFLDINLPGINGLDFIRTIKGRYHIVLTTAYHQYAVEGFELDVADYLLKPVTPERFARALTKVRDRELIHAVQEQENAKPWFFVKSNGIQEKVPFADVLYVEALQNYVLIHLQHRKLIIYSSLKAIENSLPVQSFMRVQKSYIVAIDKVDRIEQGRIIVGSAAISIGRAHKDEVLKRIKAK